MVNIKIKYLRDIEKLEILSCGDWIDLRCGRRPSFMQEYKMIPLGVAMELPLGL